MAALPAVAASVPWTGRQARAQGCMGQWLPCVQWMGSMRLQCTQLSVQTRLTHCAGREVGVKGPYHCRTFDHTQSKP